jgi:DNA polymerase III epsilon subunit-like protein
VNPQRSIPAQVTQIHGIRDQMVVQCPTFEELLPVIQSVFENVHRVIIYNADFDTGFFPVHIWNSLEVVCCMKEFMFIFQELEGHFSSKRFPLAKSFNVSTGRKIEELGKPHRALTDCLACSMVWKWCLQKRRIIDDPFWIKSGYRVFCRICQKKTFHKFRPRYRDDLQKYYQCQECQENNVSVTEMDLFLKQQKE